MNVALCKNCPSRCYLFRTVEGIWFHCTHDEFIKNRRVPCNSKLSKQCLMHENDAIDWTTNLFYWRANRLDFPKDFHKFFDEVEPTRYCTRYAEQILEDWNK